MTATPSTDNLTPPETATGIAAELAGLGEEIQHLLGVLLAAEAQWTNEIADVDETNRSSAVNLVHYWALRQYDLRSLQKRLAAFGLSSLGRSEPHVRATLEAIAGTLSALTGETKIGGGALTSFDEGPRLLQQRAVELFGPESLHRQTRIMVTLPPEAATDQSLVRELVEKGMNLARINCAHDDPRAWAAMIGHVRAASSAAGRECRIAMDLAGPKLRTGPLADGPQVIKLHPTRDRLGRVTAAAQCWLVPMTHPSEAALDRLPAIPVPPDWLACLRVGDRVSLHDARGAHRHLTIDELHDGLALASAARSTYVATGSVLHTARSGHAAVQGLAPTEQFLSLSVGDELVLTRDCAPVLPRSNGALRIGCTLPEAFDNVQPGHAVHFDDGKIGGTVLTADHDHITIKITAAASGGSKLRGAKGVNFPDTELPVSALTGADRANLPYIVANSDLVELSFVRTRQDVKDLLSLLDELGDHRLGVVLKIETAHGFQNLPEILLAVMNRPNAGVMIARGDLAVECGYDRLAELQEEILWLCEAARLPAVWATQVLDQMARSGLPSRAEITDAAMGVRAECVMLNKGPHIVDAVMALDDILGRMSGHHYKKNALLRPLQSWPMTVAEDAQ